MTLGGRADANPQVVLGRRQRAVKSEAAKGAGPFWGSLPPGAAGEQPRVCETRTRSPGKEGRGGEQDALRETRDPSL